MFSDREKRGVLYILLLILVAILCVDMAKRRSTERRGEVAAGGFSESASDSSETTSSTLFEFDPNSVTLDELCRLGLSKKVAVSILRWRSTGKVFRIKEDLYECYNLTDSIYYALEPYIKIAEEYQYTKAEREHVSYENRSFGERATPKYMSLTKFLIDTVSAEYLNATGVMSYRQAEVVVNWHKRGRMYEMNDLRKCYVVSESAADALEPFVIFPPREKMVIDEADLLVDINKADTAELVSVYGIGEKSAAAIIEYRQKLGGFYSISQISEVVMVLESNFERIITQISCDSCDISKIDINFAVAKKLIGHPYISSKALRRLLKTRQIKGGWSSIAEMTEDDIFTKEEAAKLRPYLLFEAYTDPRKQPATQIEENLY